MKRDGLDTLYDPEQLLADRRRYYVQKFQIRRCARERLTHQLMDQLDGCKDDVARRLLLNCCGRTTLTGKPRNQPKGKSMRRLIDSAIWGSRKIRKVPARYQAEYAVLLPLAEANGVFVYDIDEIHHQVYSKSRPHISKNDVARMLYYFEKAGMVARFMTLDALEQPVEDRTVYGYFLGMEKPGRLPKKKLVRYPDWDPDLQLTLESLPIYQQMLDPACDLPELVPESESEYPDLDPALLKNRP